MRWRSHRAIARAVLRRLGLPPEAVEAGAEGSVEPDVAKEKAVRISMSGRVYVGNARHHDRFEARRLAMEHIWRARRAYLAGDLTNASREVGRAMHYIHDACTGVGLLYLRHDEVEEAIAELKVPRDAVEAGVRDAVSSPFAVERALAGIKPSTKPEEALRRATYISAYVAAAVFSPGDAEAARAEVERLKRRRNYALAATAAAAFLALASPILLIAPIASFAVAAHYWGRASKLRAWFGL